MTLAVVLLTLAVAVLGVLVAGLLRSHAAILRRLHELGAGLEEEPRATGASLPLAANDPPAPRTPRPPPVPTGRPAADISGTDPAGDAVAIRVTGTDHDTVLAFLSTGCDTCHAFWQAFDADPDLPASTRLVIVTEGPEFESPAAVAALAPSGVTVVMSTEAWRDHAVPGSPYVALVDGTTGRISGEGTGGSWGQVRRLLGDAGADANRARRGKAAADANREADVDSVLRSAGIGPGDPQLYPAAGTAPAPVHGEHAS